MTKELHVARGFNLPQDSILDKTFILAKSGAGKSTTAADIVEETLDSKVQTIILDPKGDWWGLRSSADGQGEGYPVHVFGGLHADLPLEAEAGKMLGGYLAANPVSSVLDLSEFTQGELYRFTADFCTAFFKEKRRNPTPVRLVLEEADEICPEGTNKVFGPDLPRCLGAVARIFKRGRFIGIGPLGITQRSASVNKNILSQSDILVIMRTTNPLDIDAVDAWLKHQPDKEKRKQVLETIQSLPTGHGFVWGPERGIFEKVHFRLRRTFDSGQTPKIGEKPVEPKILAKVDLDKLRGEMASIVEKAKENDPVQLRNRVRQLEAELKKALNGSGAAKERLVEKRIEVPVYDAGHLTVLRRSQDQLAELGKILKDIDRNLSVTASDIERKASRKPTVHAPVRTLIAPRDPVVKVGAAEQWNTPPAPGGFKRQTIEGRPSQHLARFLDTLAELEAVGFDSASRPMVCGFHGIKATTGTVQTYFSELKKAGLIDYAGDGMVRLTDEGRKLALPRPAPVDEDQIRERVRPMLVSTQNAILDILLKAYPSKVHRETVLGELQLTNSGTFQTYISDMKRWGLITYPGDGLLKAAPWLKLQEQPQGGD